MKENIIELIEERIRIKETLIKELLDDITGIFNNKNDNELGVNNIMKINSNTKIIEYTTIQYLELTLLLSELKKSDE